MSNIHKNSTISFRPTPYKRKEIEARIKASGLSKRIFYTRSCLYDRICEVPQTQSNGSDVTIRPQFGPALVPPNTASEKIIQMSQRKII